jgi:hypothetical protein
LNAATIINHIENHTTELMKTLVPSSFQNWVLMMMAKMATNKPKPDTVRIVRPPKRLKLNGLFASFFQSISKEKKTTSIIANQNGIANQRKSHVVLM